jgi:hypothetical protein
MDELPGEFSVPKTTGTHADVFTAVGLADLLQPACDEPVEIRDRGAAFGVDLESLSVDWRERVPHSPGYKFLLDGKGRARPPKGIDVVDVPAEFERQRRYFENLKKAKGKRADPEMQAAIQQEAPVPRWPVLTLLMPGKLKAIDTWNRVALAISDMSCEEFKRILAVALRNMAAGLPAGVKLPASSSGLICPPQIKGFNELKPAGTARASVPVEPFVEWLRYRGYWRCAHAVSMGESARVYVPVPGRIPIDALSNVVGRLEKQARRSSGPKSDILTALAIARILIEGSEEYHQPGTAAIGKLRLLQGESPADIVSSLCVTEYVKTSRQAYGVRSISVLAIPGWFAIRSSRDADDWLTILDEHQKAIGSLADNRSEEIQLLLLYREFLQARGQSALQGLLMFLGSYACFVMSANGTTRDGRVRWVRRFASSHIERLIMGTDNALLPIVHDRGFQAIARAVREVTVRLQNRKARKEEVWREVRYELLPDLLRTRQLPGNSFVECVMQFASNYNRENSRRRESERNLKAAPANISDEELARFISLVDEHRAPLVGALLAAFGSCKTSGEPDAVTSSGVDENEGRA